MADGRPDLRARAAALRKALPPRRGATPPEERGRRLATLPRGPGEELRVTWDSYDGHPYLGLRLWRRDDSGGWWPDRDKGLTVRLRELSDFAAAVAEAVDLAAAARRSDPRTGEDPY